MKTLLAALVLFAATHASAAPVTVTGKFVVKTMSSAPCNPAESLLGEVKVETSDARNSGIISSCEILNALLACKSQSGVLTFDNVSTGDWTFPDFVTDFSCKP